VVFKEKATVATVLSQQHHMEKRLLQIKSAAAKGEHTPVPYKGSLPILSNKLPGPTANHKVVEREEYKILVTRLHPDVTSEYMRVYFEEKIGGPEGEGESNDVVLDSTVIWDSIKNSSRCFGYVWFRQKSDMEKAVAMGKHVIMGKEASVESGKAKLEQKAEKARGFNPYQVQMKRQVEACPPGESQAWFKGGKLFGRRGWRAGYGSFSFGPLGWGVEGWEGNERVPIEEYKGSEEWTGFSFKGRREEEERARRTRMKREVEEARELDRKRQRRS
jgi:hypothetical protein